MVQQVSPASFDLSILTRAQRSLWPSLGHVPERFVLYGGTAIALRLSHRVSVDFDFFSSVDFTTDSLIREIPFLEKARRVQESPNTLTVLYEAPGCARPVKLSFFGGLSLGQIEPPQRADNGVWIASLVDLLGMKCATVSQRVEAKDYIDIHAIVSRPGFSLRVGLAAAGAIYGRQYNGILTLKSLVYFEGGNLETLPETVRQDLVNAVKQCDVADIRTLSARGPIGGNIAGRT
ncbi:MAG: nucleotidyl transferase AbiEii/AbiGii toxin family protein [Deltaproteobacteria bacterium]|nr:nucleotidyl transferase AbiEii/AbiGii toxin family protein [Deltaproteobacteria bacterium]MBW2110539.1 nucleotidyl transferase AbiEii/AbiGii toxin family protein [Deltaproteobacteria bacterium]MBW2353675.1 nucleotidyl transferase AbiEii/AbiGii toxin family protein [Deltaproteobacteria bacterium]